ncbi:class II aldolase/adducin family protein [Kordiimonas sp. SCSIO 12610]|uniref:class II aldolase/adducin family protein n=1 Tax=Kordiimonas sp. SCSIO 12610 TaxID=2829597 RepID=UPI00210BB82A|nr:class II aldolase/adducin family protein [Kordiimonas sp. SCSIO 12610]UTW56769.1 class II aldolase/adducin family protein [Kordiimonas sp. SCSIO 12610]
MATAQIAEIPSVKDQVSPEEWEARVNLAAAYRLVAHFGWDDLIYTHISARVPGGDHHFLINPLGLMFEEITASSLIKVDLEGNKLNDSPYIANKAGFVIHSAIHAAREDAGCVIHLHTDYGIAVSNQKDGLLPLAQSSIPGWLSLAYHDFEGLAVRDDEKERLVADMGEKNALMLRNHGTLTAGKSIAQAFELMYFLEKACKIQILTQTAGAEIQHPSEESIQNTINDLQAVAGANGADLLVWPALLRKLDRMDSSFRD